jgi:CubicO group peptidase (beta-lactamase class C family)
MLTAGVTGVTALTPALVAQLVAQTPAGAVTDEETSGERSTLALAEPLAAYHGVSGATHQQRFNQLSALGYRMISLSVYGSRFNPLYAAVWVKRVGPAWAAVHGVDAAGYQAKVNQYVAAGYVPVLVSATGPRSNPVFAAVFEKLPAGAWMARHGLVDGPATTAGTLASVNKWARDNNCIPRSLAIYGGVTDRTYAGVWLPNTVGIKWQAHQMGNGTQYQAWFDAYKQVPLRPANVDASDPLQYAAIFTDDSVGTWVTRHGMTAAQYQAEFDAQLAQGRYPISVQGGGLGTGIRYAATFAGRDRPIARAWTQTNAVGAAYAGIHAVMRNFMQSRGVRAGVLAVRKNGALKLSAGYTWAEPGYAITRPDSLLRIASVSKAFACAAIQRLVAAGRLSLNWRVFPLLGINTVALPGQTRDPRIDSITVRHCVEHAGGWVRRVSGFDPVFRTREIARALNLPGRASKRDVARYMYGEPLQYTPGDTTTYNGDDRYSNFGYVLLGLVVERVTGLSFHNYLTQAVLNPLGIGGQVLVGATPRSGRRPTEVSYEESSVGASAWDPWSDLRVPTAYGNFLIEAMDSGGGLIATAPAVTAFINQHAVWGLGGRAAGAARSGQMAGSRSFAASRGNGIDWCYTINTAEMYNTSATLSKLTTDLNAAIDASGI